MVPPDTIYQLINHSTKVTAMMYYTIVDFVADDDEEEMAGSENRDDDSDNDGNNDDEDEKEAGEEEPVDESMVEKDEKEAAVAQADAAVVPLLVAPERVPTGTAVALPAPVGAEAVSSSSGERVVAESNV